jgi:predicted nucleic acid-binding Zn finger protein
MSRFLPVAPESLCVTAVDEWERLLDDEGELTPEAVERITETHGDRGTQAIEAVGERRVKQYRDFTVVVGHTEEYVVEAGSCTCKDAEYNLDSTDPEQLCWHAIAVRIARAIDATDDHDMWYSDVHEFL